MKKRTKKTVDTDQTTAVRINTAAYKKLQAYCVERGLKVNKHLGYAMTYYVDNNLAQLKLGAE